MKALGIAILYLASGFIVSAQTREEAVHRLEFSEIRAKAEKGDAWGQGMVGDCYANGRGVATNLVEAVKWYRKAASQNDPWALGTLGYCYQHGQGVQTNHAEAVKWYRKAAGYNNAWAQFALGVCYETGQGVELDRKEALRHYRKAADKNYALAQYHMGLKSQWQTNYVEAAKWFQKAANNSNAWAQFYLGNCYANGQGVKTNVVEAAAWLSLSAETYAPAATNLNVLTKLMSRNKWLIFRSARTSCCGVVKWGIKAADR